MSHRIIVGTIATTFGIYACWDAARDFELIKYTPYSAEEVEQRKREKKGLKITHLDVRTLDYTEEAKAKIRKIEEQKAALEAKNE